MAFFFFEEVFPKLGKEPAHPALVAATTEHFNSLAKQLGLSTDFQKPTYDWRKVFSLKEIS